MAALGTHFPHLTFSTTSRGPGNPVVAVFDNLLPDSSPIRRRLAERAHAGGEDAYSLLTAIGRDCVGALQFLPGDEEPEAIGEPQGQTVSDKRIAAILTDLAQAPLGVSVEDEEFRISIAGAQEKTALLYWKDHWRIPNGSTPTTHILKPQIGVLKSGIDLSHSVENEHFCMELARSLGLPTAKTNMVDFEDQRVLVVERFDRQWTGDHRLLRLPQEDCCQALSIPPTHKYQADGGPGIEQVLELLKASDNPEEDQRLFIRAQLVFWLMGATDGHAKNFSLFLYPGGGFRLTPLYDVMSAQPLVRSKVYQASRIVQYNPGTCDHPVVPQIAEIRAHKSLNALIRGISMAQWTIRSMAVALRRIARFPLVANGEH
jgi:serine/threonine-protein kinase HipA